MHAVTRHMFRVIDLSRDILHTWRFQNFEKNTLKFNLSFVYIKKIFDTKQNASL